MANDCIPLYEEGDRVPCIVDTGGTNSVGGKTFVAYSSWPTAGAGTKIPPGISDTLGANIKVKTVAAGLRVFGVAAWDAAAGAPVTVIRGHGHIVPVIAGAAVTAGQFVEADAAGKAIPNASGQIVGQAMNTAATGEDVYVDLLR